MNPTTVDLSTCMESDDDSSYEKTLSFKRRDVDVTNVTTKTIFIKTRKWAKNRLR